MLTKIILPKHSTTKEFIKLEASSEIIPHSEGSDDSLSFVSSLGSDESFSQINEDSVVQEQSIESS